MFDLRLVEPLAIRAEAKCESGLVLFGIKGEKARAELICLLSHALDLPVVP